MKTVQTTTQTNLYSYRAEKLTLKDAIATCQQQLKGAIALLYSPQSCQLAKLMPDGTLHGSDNHPLDLTKTCGIFEARIFNPTCELRWLNRMSGAGDAVLISEVAQTVESFSALDPIPCESLKQKYLLWGQEAKNSAISGWQRLAEARIGKLDIPISQKLQKNQRFHLSTREYLASTDKYGNFAVIEERLMKLEVA